MKGQVRVGHRSGEVDHEDVLVFLALGDEVSAPGPCQSQRPQGEVVVHTERTAVVVSASNSNLRPAANATASWVLGVAWANTDFTFLMSMMLMDFFLKLPVDAGPQGIIGVKERFHLEAVPLIKVTLQSLQSGLWKGGIRILG